MLFYNPITYKKILSSLSGAEGVVEGLSSSVQRALTVLCSAHLYMQHLRKQRGIILSVIIFFVLVLLIASCAPTATPVPEAKPINVYATPATQTWLAGVFACAPAGTFIHVVDLPASADISLRLGEPELLITPAFQIDTEEILIVTHRQSPMQNMTLGEVRELFAGQGDPSIQVWVYASGEDVQRVFEQAVMQGRSVTSLARLATSPQHMSDILNNEPNTVGVLPRHWKAGDSRFVYTIPDVPVLALTAEEPQGAIQAIIACLQK
jgi:hypothetical protein